MSDTAVIEAHYLPSIEYFCALLPYQTIRLEAFEHFQKQTYRNRAYILGANNIQSLTIPVIKGNSKVVVKDLKIDNSQRWNSEHWRSIKSAYGRAPFFEYFSDYFQAAYASPTEYLLDFNEQLLTICLELLQLKKTCDRTSAFDLELKSGPDDHRGMITPKKDYISREYFSPAAYIQVFGKNFVPNLSVIDLLMNEGPNAGSILLKSKKSE